MRPPSDAGPVEVTFAPRWWSLTCAALVAALAFFLPQSVPVQWKPLEPPGNDILYLQLTCKADRTGEVQIFYDLDRGINELDSIRVPLSASERWFTYTFPLPDAPIVGLRFDPLDRGGTVTIQQMRIINRAEIEIRRFNPAAFIPLHQISEIRSGIDGWSITSTADGNDPFLRVDLVSPIVPAGMNARNFQRCALSSGYLATMLWLLFLGITFSLDAYANRIGIVRSLAGLAFIAALFSLVGNRGLIRNSIHSAQFIPPTISRSLALEIDLEESSHAAIAQLFWDSGGGFREEDSQRVRYRDTAGLQTLQFRLPAGTIKGLRFDPLDGPSTVVIRRLRIVDTGGNTKAIFPLSSIRPGQQVARVDALDGAATVITDPDARDPFIVFSPVVTATINEVVAKLRTAPSL